MSLKSHSMNLTASEKHWLPWFGGNAKFKLWWSCIINKTTYTAVEQTFEGIAATRVKLLHIWTENHWDHLQTLVSSLNINNLENSHTILKNKLGSGTDFSEIFIINVEGKILTSTTTSRIGKIHDEKKAIEQATKKAFLHGPYIDPVTLQIGPSSSKFHDEVTLMFYEPIIQKDRLVAFVCGRVPNDVLGDLIQREAGHIYPESGDNYLFMVNSNFDTSIVPGIALSRSRFEDSTFSHGENLKSGVHTNYGTVKINRHTEFEIKFTDPATNELHPGVRETIRRGENLYVLYPGYSDYRHIPVIGKGVTFNLPGSIDKWGMMCEGDLEEVYRRRSINLSLMKLYFIMVISILGIHEGLYIYSDLSDIAIKVITGVSAMTSCLIFSKFGTNRISKRLNKMTEVIRTIAEGEGNLTQRLDSNKIKHDETGDMSRWINSFIDNLDGIVGQVINASTDVKKTNENMLARNEEAHSSSSEVYQSMEHMQQLIEEQNHIILQASLTAESLKLAMASVVQTAKKEYEEARAGTQEIRDIVDTTARSVQSIDSRMEEIGNIISVITGITSQTNLLALNAAIEAARAGEHGRGFSVVADEVRGLASRTATAAKDIQTMIQGLQAETQQAVGFMESGVKNVDQNLKLTEAASNDNQELHNIVDEIFQTINIIEKNSILNGETAKKVTEVTKNMKYSIAELAQSSNMVDSTAGKLQQLVGVFTISAR